MLTFTLLECLGWQLTPDLQVDCALDVVAVEVQQFWSSADAHSQATLHIQNAQEELLRLLRQLHHHSQLCNVMGQAGQSR